MKGYIFDLDGTLLDSQWVWKSSTIEIFDELGLADAEGIYQQIRSFSLEEANDFIIQHFDLPYTIDSMIERISDKVKEKYSQFVEPKAGVMDKLHQFKQAGIKMVIATASEKQFIMHCLERVGLTDLMDYVITTSEYHTNKKDEAVIYDVACELIGLGKDDVLVFEDALHAIKTLKKHDYQVCAVADDDELDHRQEIMTLADQFIDNWSEF